MYVDPTRPHEPSSGDRLVKLTQLVVVFSPEGKRIPHASLERHPVLLGRDGGEGTVKLDDTEVSRKHALVTPVGESWEIVDQESRNGVIVDGERSQRAPLRNGSVIRVGRTLLLFVVHEARAGDRLAPETAIRGVSLAMQRVRGEIATVAPHPVPVLILGETGVGKDLVATEIHRLSGRRGRFVPVNCAALPESLAESELFGHQAGAFTGAVRTTEGLFAEADGGTLFLDEVGELPPGVQTKLLRSLAAGEIRPLGEHRVARKVDARVVAATNRDLGAAIADKGFRSDLFARLRGWVIHVAPLRERKEDILVLASAILHDAGRKLALSTGAAEALLLHPFPLNVRELKQALEQAAVRAQGAVIRLRDLPPEIAAHVAHRADAEPGAAPLPLLVPAGAKPTQGELVLVLERFQGNISRTAAFFGRDRKQIYRWMREYGIQTTGRG
jgi:DNA-binding NtrC family response regulator